MNINYIESTCPNCGKKIKENCNTWLYGSPIRKCSSCNTEYLDKRWREAAIDGFDPRSTNSAFYLKAALTFLVFTIACSLYLAFTINILGHYSAKVVACICLGALATFACSFLYLRIKLGFEDKKNNTYLQESKERLKDAEYINKLENYGYTIPDEYKYR
ncbi:MAG: hypothetical protein IJ736_09460 [Firmicutes bacterium]|nr:hypothetical protein [Bacillota bacterium]